MKSWTTSHRSTAVADFCEHSVDRMWKKSTLILIGLYGEGGNSADPRGQSECTNINSWYPRKEIVIATGHGWRVRPGQRVVEGGVSAASALDKLLALHQQFVLRLALQNQLCAESIESIKLADCWFYTGPIFYHPPLCNVTWHWQVTI